MDIKDFLSLDLALLDLRVTDKARLLQQLADRAAVALSLPSDRVAAELRKREALGSTGTGGGVAIPHARMPEVHKPFGLVARLKQAIPFDAIDEKPVDLVFLLLLPVAASEQLNALASVARKLRDPSTLRRLRAATDGGELYRVMVGSSRI